MPTAWPAKTVLKLIFLRPKPDTAAIDDDNNLVVEGIIDIGQSLVGAGGGLIDLGWALHVQGFVRAFVVEDFDEVIEAGLLLKEI